MAKQQMLVINRAALITALIDKGILPAGTTGGAANTTFTDVKIILTNDSFDDVVPPAQIPTSTVDVPAGIELLTVPE